MSQTIHELQGTLRAGEAATLRAALAEALSQGDVQVATADLTAIDGAIVQVLLSARRSAEQLERKLQVEIPDGGALATMRDRLALGAAFGPSAVDTAAA
jgi:anti-anti-sigma regulatory factor